MTTGGARGSTGAGGRAGVCLLSSSKPETVDGVDMELQLVPTLSSPDSPIDALWRWVGEGHLGRHVVVKLLRRVGQHRILASKRRSNPSMGRNNLKRRQCRCVSVVKIEGTCGKVSFKAKVRRQFILLKP
jgi:hypothetical protein